MAKLITVCTLLALASIKCWHLEQLDINNAFLQGDLNKEFHMTLPRGYNLFHSSSTSQVCKLNKSIYGLKQASLQWYFRLSESLISLGYNHSHVDYSLFTKCHANTFTALLVYVNDIVLIGNLPKIQHVKALLHHQFRMKDLGPFGTSLVSK